jgi:hypothetical protein
LIRFSGIIKGVSGKPITGVAGVTFALYKDEAGGPGLSALFLGQGALELRSRRPRG